MTSEVQTMRVRSGLQTSSSFSLCGHDTVIVLREPLPLPFSSLKHCTGNAELANMARTTEVRVLYLQQGSRKQGEADRLPNREPATSSASGTLASHASHAGAALLLEAWDRKPDIVTPVSVQEEDWLHRDS